MRRLVCSFLSVVALALPAQEPKPSKTQLEKEARAAVEEQRWADAAAAFRKLTEIDPQNARAWHMAGYCLHADRKLDEALQFHHKATEFPATRPAATYNVACVHALKGEKDKAFDWLAKAADAGFGDLDLLATDPDLDSLRADPRWEKFVAQVKSKPVDKSAYQIFSANAARGSTRLLLWGSGGPLGQVHVDYGAPVWKEEHAGALTSPKFENHRWRLGKDFWTTLDTQLTLQIGGREVAPGAYYLTLERRADGRFLLALLDPDEIRRQKLDAYLAHKTTGGIEVEMKLGEADAPAEKLEIELVPDSGSKSKAELQIRFGPHMLSAPVTIQL
jgi:hypothetical protein